MARRTGHPSVEIMEKVAAELERLVDVSREHPPTKQTRRAVDKGVRLLVERMERLLGEIDPIKQPRSVFDPGDPAIVGGFVSLALIAQPRFPLGGIEPFYGSGVYALYYTGYFPAYEPIMNSETPIYVGKADPRTDHAREPSEQGERL